MFCAKKSEKLTLPFWSYSPKTLQSLFFPFFGFLAFLTHPNDLKMFWRARYHFFHVKKHLKKFCQNLGTPSTKVFGPAWIQSIAKVSFVDLEAGKHGLVQFVKFFKSKSSWIRCVLWWRMNGCQSTWLLLYLFVCLWNEVNRYQNDNAVLLCQYFAIFQDSNSAKQLTITHI